MPVLHCVLRRIAQEDRSRNETVPFAEFRNNEGVYVNGENESKMKHTKMRRHTHARTTEREWKRERMSRCAHNVFTSSQLNEAPEKEEEERECKRNIGREAEALCVDLEVIMMRRAD